MCLASLSPFWLWVGVRITVGDRYLLGLELGIGVGLGLEFWVGSTPCPDFTRKCFLARKNVKYTTGLTPSKS